MATVGIQELQEAKQFLAKLVTTAKDAIHQKVRFNVIQLGLLLAGLQKDLVAALTGREQLKAELKDMDFEEFRALLGDELLRALFRLFRLLIDRIP